MNPDKLALKIEDLTLNVGEDRIDPETAHLIEVYNLDLEDVDLGLIILERLENVKHTEKVTPYPLAIPVNRDVLGPIRLGYVSNSERTEPSIFGMFPEELCMHVLAVGPTGCGKTNLNYLLMKEAHRFPKIRFLVFSFMREYRPLTKMFLDYYVFRRGQFKINPLHPMGLNFGKWSNYFAEIFARYSELRIASKGFILKQLHNLTRLYSGNGYPSLFDLLAHIEGLRLPRYSKDSNYRDSSTSRLRGFLTSAGEECDCSRGTPINEVLKMNTVIELDGLLPEYQATIISFILNWILLYKLQKDNGLINVIIIDEGQNVFSKQHEKDGISPISTLVSQVRKGKVGLVINAQIPRLLNESVLANTDTKIVLGIGDGRDAQLMHQSMGSNYQQRDFMFSLDQEEALVKLGYRFFRPFGIRIPQAYEEQIIPDQEIEKNNQRLDKHLIKKFKKRISLREILAMGKQEHADQKTKNKERTREKILQREFSTDELRVMANIYNQPLVLSSLRSETLFLSSYKFFNIKKKLKEYLCIQEITFSSGKRGQDPKLFDITEQGAQTFGLDFSTMKGGGSFLHRVFQKEIAARGKQQGYQVNLEQEFNGKRVDVLWMKEGETIGFEIALMSANHEVENIKRCIEAGIKHVVSYCRTNEIKKKIEADLSQQNLFFPVDFRLLSEFIKKEK